MTEQVPGNAEPARPLAKTLIALADDRPLMLVLSPTRYVDISKLLRLLGSHSVRLASRYEVARLFPECDLEAVPPFGRMLGIPVYVDLELAEQAQITFLAGTRDDIITMPMGAFEQASSAIRSAISLATRTPDA